VVVARRSGRSQLPVAQEKAQEWPLRRPPKRPVAALQLERRGTENAAGPAGRKTGSYAGRKDGLS